MSTFRSISGPLPKSLPLRGDDYVVKHGATTITKQSQPGHPEKITIDHPGTHHDVGITIGRNDIRVDFADPSRDSVTIRPHADGIQFAREDHQNDSTLYLDDNVLDLKRSRYTQDARFIDDGYRFKIDRHGLRDDVSGSSSGRVQRAHLDRLPSPEALGFVDRALDNGLRLDDMVTVTREGLVVVWDETLL